jgi:hypothetical protein
LVRRRVVVTEIDGSGWAGVAFEVDDTGLVLAGAAGEALQRLGHDGASQEVDGVAFVPAARIQVVQCPDGWGVGGGCRSCRVVG